MKINVIFFGMAADITGKNQMEFADQHDTDGFRKLLLKKYINLNKNHFIFALNKKIVKENTRLNNGDTIAVLPPFSGG